MNVLTNAAGHNVLGRSRGPRTAAVVRHKRLPGRHCEGTVPLTTTWGQQLCPAAAAAHAAAPPQRHN